MVGVEVHIEIIGLRIIHILFGVFRSNFNEKHILVKPNFTTVCHTYQTLESRFFYKVISNRK